MEKQWFEKHKKYISGLVTVVSVLFFVKYILTLVMPFFIALCLVSVAQPIFQWLEEKLHIRKRVIAVFLLVLLISAAGFLLWYLVVQGCSWIGTVSANMAEYEAVLNGFVRSCCKKAEQFIGINGTAMEDAVFLHMNHFTADMKSRAIPKLMNQSVIYVRIFLTVAGFGAMTLIATALLAKDFRKIQEDLRKYRWFLAAESVGAEIGRMAARYVKAQAIIMGTISIVSGIGLWITGIHNGLIIGVLTGLLDVLPFIGTGIILIPIALWQLIQGEIWRCAGIILLYILCILLREFLEPKLIGKEMDIYPVVVLLAIYAGIQWYGLAGVVLGPLSFLLIREIWRKIPDF